MRVWFLGLGMELQHAVSDQKERKEGRKERKERKEGKKGKKERKEREEERSVCYFSRDVTLFLSIFDRQEGVYALDDFIIRNAGRNQILHQLPIMRAILHTHQRRKDEHEQLKA